MLPLLDPIVVPSQEDALALATGFRFDDKRFGLSEVELFLEGLEILRYQPCHWEEAEVLWKVLLHGDQILR